jgi:XTP/dITP diphosphohydrolase
MRLFIASTNQGKLRDFTHAAANFPQIELAPLPGLDTLPVPVEDAPTFQGNAEIKALAYSRRAPDTLILADDSGLEVDALALAPGVRSARYADDKAFTTSRPLPMDVRNNLCLLDALGSTREADRTARYRCVLALARNGEILATASGSVEGEILAVPRGSGGFGYDPLFLLADVGRTMAELAAEERHLYSHRGRALRVLLDSLQRSNTDFAQTSR